MLSYIRKLYVQVLLGFVLGCLLGYAYPTIAVQLLPLAEGFIKLIKMCLGPIVFCFVVNGIVRAGSLRVAGRVAFRTIVYFEIITTLALLIGVIVTMLLKPGAGMNIDLTTLDASSVAGFVGNADKVTDIKSFLLNIIPSTFVEPFVTGDILQVLLISMLFGCALLAAGEKATRVGRLFESITEVLLNLIGYIVKLAPLGVMGAMAFAVGKFGFGTLQQLLALVFTYYLACAFFLFVVLGLVMKLCGLSLIKFIVYFKDEILIALASGSSDAVMPNVMRKLEHLGVKNTTVALVIPMGYSFNLDGFSIWLTCAAIFIAQATNTPLAFESLALILLVSILTSKGSHGIPGAATVVLAATLTAIPSLPVIGIALILPIDKLLGFFRVALNLIGNCVGAVAVGRWEGHLDLDKARRVLTGQEAFVCPEEPATP